MNGNLGGVLEALRREHQGVTTLMGGKESPPTVDTATVMLSSYNSGSDPEIVGREERRRAKKESKRRER